MSENISNPENEQDLEQLPSFSQENWFNIRKNYFSKNCHYVAFEPKQQANDHWHYLIDLEHYENLYLSKKSKDGGINNDLKQYYDPLLYNKEERWINNSRKIKPLGLLIPNSEIDTLEPANINGLLSYYYNFIHNFNFNIFIETTRTHILIETEYESTGVIVWNYFINFTQFLRQLKREDYSLLSTLGDYVVDTIDLVKFEKSTISAQAIALFKFLITIQFFSSRSNVSFPKLMEKSSLSVNQYFKKYHKAISACIENGFDQTPINLKEGSVEIEQVKNGFFQLFNNELIQLQIQEILDNYSGHNFLEALPKTKILLTDSSNIKASQKAKEKSKKNNFLDRIQSHASQLETIEKARLQHKATSLFKENTLSFHELDTGLSNQIKEEIRSLSEENGNSLKKVAWSRMILHHKNQLNELFAPFLNWEHNDRNFYPQLNLKTYNLGLQLFYKQQKELIAEEKESGILEAFVNELAEAKSEFIFKNILQKVPTFTFKHLQKKWDDLVSIKTKDLEYESHFRLAKMRALGILEGEEKPSMRSEAWLDEMLLIEKEITPYISFVKKAFENALPQRKTYEFDPYRHNTDGVEFDPETIQDLNKWNLGEVMKTLKLRVDVEHAEQINVIAMDLSGSMEHDKLRGLYKLLYLIILGLEDRQTYDSFHFFGTNFVETANFSEHYTSRNLLFKILRKIAIIDNKHQIFYWGRGGTNISEAVVECHNRLTDFSKKLDQIKPNTVHLCSIFVITDGEPSVGITNLEQLGQLIEAKRHDGNIAIKGIFVKPHEDVPAFMEEVFGANNYVETINFSEAISELVFMMTRTYKLQRKKLKASKKRKSKNYEK